MKKSLLNVAVFTAAVIGTAGFSACATTKSAETRNKEVSMKSFNGNPWELVYDGAITENVNGKVNIRPVTYDLNGIAISANLYLPADYDESDSKKYPALTVAHPNGGSKEQVAGLYAQKLAEAGYITIAADASYQGASGGEPRLRDWPANRINDVSGMVDYLVQLPKVDSARIGSLGICGGGGYTLAASQTDKRIRARLEATRPNLSSSSWRLTLRTEWT